MYTFERETHTKRERETETDKETDRQSITVVIDIVLNPNYLVIYLSCESLIVTSRIASPDVRCQFRGACLARFLMMIAIMMIIIAKTEPCQTQ